MGVRRRGQSNISGFVYGDEWFVERMTEVSEWDWAVVPLRWDSRFNWEIAGMHLYRDRVTKLWHAIPVWGDRHRSEYPPFHSLREAVITLRLAGDIPMRGGG